MTDQPDPSPSFAHTLHGDDLSWLHLMLDGALPARYRLPDDPTEPRATCSAGARSPRWQCRRSSLDLLDPEGVTLASGDRGGRRRRLGRRHGRGASGFSIVDHVALRARRRRRRTQPWPTGPVWALWVGRAGAVRRPRGSQAAAEPRGRQSPRSSRSRPDARPVGWPTLPVRLALAATTREGADRLVVVPGRRSPWDDDGISAPRPASRPRTARTELLVAPGSRTASPHDTTIPRAASSTCLTDHTVVPTEDARRVGDRGRPRCLPWAAEPPVAAELRLRAPTARAARAHRPAQRAVRLGQVDRRTGAGGATRRAREPVGQPARR